MSTGCSGILHWWNILVGYLFFMSHWVHPHMVSQRNTTVNAFIKCYLLFTYRLWLDSRAQHTHLVYEVSDLLFAFIYNEHRLCWLQWNPVQRAACFIIAVVCFSRPEQGRRQKAHHRAATARSTMTGCCHRLTPGPLSRDRLFDAPIMKCAKAIIIMDLVLLHPVLIVSSPGSTPGRGSLSSCYWGYKWMEVIQYVAKIWCRNSVSVRSGATLTNRNL